MGRSKRKMITITRTSPITGITHTTNLDMTQVQYDAALVEWGSGTLIQNAFPTLDADQREFIKSGIPPHEWDEFYGEE
jgi:hypothetical protein